MSPPQRSVRPIERRKSVSPEKSVGASPSRRKQVEPGVCPGVWSTRSVYGPKRIRSPSSRGASGGSGAVGAQAEERRLLGQRVVQRAVGGVEADRRAGRLLDLARSRDVVEVRVRVEESDGRELRRLEGAQDALGLVARIDDDGLARLPGPRGSCSCTGAARPERSRRAGPRSRIDRDDGLDVVALLALRVRPDGLRRGEVQLHGPLLVVGAPALGGEELAAAAGREDLPADPAEVGRVAVEVEGGDLLARPRSSTARDGRRTKPLAARRSSNSARTRAPGDVSSWRPRATPRPRIRSSSAPESSRSMAPPILAPQGGGTPRRSRGRAKRGSSGRVAARV